MPSGTLVWTFLNGFVGFRYFGFYFRHLKSISDLVYALIMPYFLYRPLLLSSCIDKDKRYRPACELCYLSSEHTQSCGHS